MRHARSLMLLAATAATSASCGEDFAPFNRLDKLRVLAIQANSSTPAPGETAMLRALVYTPPGEQVTGWQWSWCPLAGPISAGAPCLITEEELRMLAGPDVPPYDLGTAETAELRHALDPQLLMAVCAGAAEQGQLALDCEGGFPIQVKLVVRGTAGETVAVSQLRLRLSSEGPGNANPVIDGLVADLPGGPAPIDDTPTVTLPRKEETFLRALVAESHAESYAAVDDEGQPVTERERIVLTWFVETGDTRSERTSFVDGSVTFEEALDNRWEPAKVEDFPGDRARIIVVIRDDRGGVSWRSGAVLLGSAP